MRILLAAPTSKAKHYCKDAWLNHLNKLTYHSFDVLIVDNTPGEEYYLEEFCGKGFKAIHVEPEGTVVEYITESQNAMLKYFRDHPVYDALFILESDVFPPYNVIEYLMHFDKPVITFPYFINYRDNHPAICLQNMEKTYVQRQTVLADGLNTFNDWNGELKQVFASGIGCTLIKREVFDYIKEFRCKTDGRETLKDSSVFSDTFFYRDLNKEGIPAYITTDGIAQHNWSDWNEHKDFINN